MLRKTKDVSIKFPPESMNQHVSSNQISSDLVVNQQDKGCKYELPIDGNLNQFRTEVLFQDGSSSESAEFRFSISRLPEWARYQVMNSSLPGDIDSTSSEVQHLMDTISVHFFPAQKDI